MKIAFGPTSENGYVNFGLNYESFVDEVDDSECTEIKAVRMLDYVPEYKFVEFMQNLARKMRHGCTISIGGHDVYETAKNILKGAYSVQTANQVLYGMPNMPRVGQYSLNVVADILLQMGLKIVEKNLEGGEMFIKAVRE